MFGTSKGELKLSLERVLKRYHGLLAGILFMTGFALRLLSINYSGFVWQIIGDFGTFLAAAIAIPFIYERFIKTEDRRLFLSDLEDVLEAKLASYANQGRYPQFHELGRLPIHQKVSFFQDARCEVIELGIALRTLVGYFEQRPYHDFKEPVVELLRQGVNFKFILLDPDRKIAEKYAQDRGEQELVINIRRSIEALGRLRDEFRAAGLPGTFEVFAYSHFPYCYVMLIDPMKDEGRALISPYMYATNRADAPVIEVYKSSNPVLFEKYRIMVENLLANSKKL